MMNKLLLFIVMLNFKHPYDVILAQSETDLGYIQSLPSIQQQLVQSKVSFIAGSNEIYFFHRFKYE